MSNQRKASRFMELEGLRGLAAVSVVVYHFAILFYPALRAGDVARAHGRFEDNIYGTPLTLFFAGNLAVAIFFVLSGFVLSIGYFQTGDESIVKKLAASRYLRLMIPALASVLLAFALVSVNVHALNKEAGNIAGSSELSAKLSTHVGFFESIKIGTFDIFVSEHPTLINGVLWTMHTEFFGSFIVFGFLLLFARSKYRWLVYVLLFVATFNTWFMPFILGVVVADLYTKNILNVLKRRVATILLLLFGIILGTYPVNSNDSYYKYLDMDIPHVNTRMLYLIIGATLIVTAALTSSWLKSLLQKPAISNLGKYTFALYLTHLFVIYTVSNTIVIVLHDIVGYNISVLLAVLTSVPVFWAVTYLFERYIDAPSIRFAKIIGEVYRGQRIVRWSSLVSKSVKNMQKHLNMPKLSVKKGAEGE